MVAPIEIERRANEGLKITWDDGKSGVISSRVLRLNCPCAGCRELRGDGGSHQTPLTPPKPRSLNIVQSSSEEETNLIKIWAVGQYALGLAWADGHDTGIYTFETLRELADK